MANIRKQFNFRNGIQVDDDNLVVSSLGLVGIGTTIPTEALDVRGSVKVVGLVTANEIYTPILNATNLSITNLSLEDSIIGGGVSIRSGVITASESGIVTYYGDGGRLLNLPTSQWLDIDVGLGFTSIYSQGYVGVATNDPRFAFQVGSTNAITSTLIAGVGINSTGSIQATGIITASKFSGIGSDITELNALNIAYGTLSNDRIPVLLNSKLPSNIIVSGVITASSGFSGNVTGNLTGNVTGNLTGSVTGNVTGNIVGIASTARSLIGNPDISVGIITASRINVSQIDGLQSTGITTLTNTVNIGLGGTIFSLRNGYLGIGTGIPSSLVQLKNKSIADVELLSETSEAKITFGQGVGVGNSATVLRFGNAKGAFEILNRDIGNINLYLHAGNAGINTGRFDWIYGQDNSELMSLTYEGQLGLGKTNPDNTLHVVGTSTVTGNAYFGNDVSIDGNATINGALTVSGSINLPSTVNGTNLYNTSGISTFYNARVTNNLNVVNNIGINTTIPKDYVKLDVTDGEATFGTVGVGTTANGVVFRSVGASILTNVAIGNTNSVSNTFGVYDGTAIFDSTSISATNNSILTLDSTAIIGIGTLSPRSTADFADAGKNVSGGAYSYMIPPRLTTAQRDGLSVVAGAFIFNTTISKFQGYTGTAWVDFH